MVTNLIHFFTLIIINWFIIILLFLICFIYLLNKNIKGPYGIQDIDLDNDKYKIFVLISAGIGINFIKIS